MTNGIVATNALSHCGSLFAGVIIVPNAPFRYQLQGYDADGNTFTRTKDIFIEAKIEECDIAPTSTSVARTSTRVILSTSVFHTSYVALSSTTSSTSTIIPTNIPTSTPSGCPEGFTGPECNIGK